MASGGALGSAIALFVLMTSLTAVLAREYTEFSLAPAPAPMEAGSAVAASLSMGFVSVSLLISLIGIIFS